jgi:hypothetical protein
MLAYYAYDILGTINIRLDRLERKILARWHLLQSCRIEYDVNIFGSRGNAVIIPYIPDPELNNFFKVVLNNLIGSGDPMLVRHPHFMLFRLITRKDDSSFWLTNFSRQYPLQQSFA